MNDAYDDDAVGWDSLVGYPDPNVTIPVSYEAFVEEWNSEMVYVFDRQGDVATLRRRAVSSRIWSNTMSWSATGWSSSRSSAGVSTDTVHTVSYMTRWDGVGPVFTAAGPPFRKAAPLPCQ